MFERRREVEGRTEEMRVEEEERGEVVGEVI